VLASPLPLPTRGWDDRPSSPINRPQATLWQPT
jgi:hypothetical protein